MTFIDLGKKLENLTKTLDNEECGLKSWITDPEYYTYFESFQAMSLIIENNGLEKTIALLNEVVQKKEVL